MDRSVAGARVRCEDVKYVLRAPWPSRDALWQTRALLRSVATDMEWTVRDWILDQPHSEDAMRAQGSLLSIQTTLRWVESNRYGLLRHEIHRALEHAHVHAVDLLTVLERRGGKRNQVEAWGGPERRQGERRTRQERRQRSRSPWDRRVADRRAPTTSRAGRRMVAG